MPLQLDEDGALLTMAVFEINNTVTTHIVPEVPGNQVSILWQIPQYVIVTAAEILFSITGLEFAFTQAPVSMKAVMQTVWLMTTAIGSLIVILVAESTLFPKQSDEFFAFAGLLGIVLLFFVYLARSYM